MRTPAEVLPGAPAQWPVELCLLSEELSHIQPPLLACRLLQLHTWLSHYAKSFCPQAPAEFIAVWCDVLRNDYQLPQALCRPLYEVLAAGAIPGRQLRDYSLLPAPPGFKNWEEAELKIHAAFRATFSNLFLR
jgi:hypothetical protein